jgi:tRNA-2-methylthio-N6-dimethylallyladenosine synthase
MNERDSEAAAAALINAGYISVKNEIEADILLFNTCSVRDQAERKAVGKIGIMKKIKKKKPAIIIGVLGCMAQNKKEKLLKDLPHIDFVLGTDNTHKLIEVLKQEEQEKQKIIKTEFNSSTESMETMGGHLLFTNSVDEDSKAQCTAYVSLMRGCNRFCSYCIVPYVRGREKSRTKESILHECKELVKKGIKEVMLLGQNVAAYEFAPGQLTPKNGESPFADLLVEISKISGLERIRFTSPHPACFNDKLIETIANLPKVCNNIHLPLQSGSDTILKAMGRGYTADQFYSIAEKLHNLCEDITFSTDIIVGYPGETDEDFNKTRDLMNKVGFDNAFIFKFSPRSGTKAAKIEDSVDQSIKEIRNSLLLKDLKKRTEANNKLYVDTTQEILVEGISKRNNLRWSGRTTTNQLVVFEPYEGIKSGDIIDVEIYKATSMTLFGKKVTS